MRLHLLSLVAIGLLGLASCGSSGAVTDWSLVNVDTVVSQNVVNAGGDFSVECVVTSPDGTEIETDTAFEVSPATGISIQGTTVTAAETGYFDVTCKLPDGSRPDATPETVLVTLNNASRIDARLSDNPISLGEETIVTCRVTTASGQILTDVETEVFVDRETEAVIDGVHLTPQAVGDFAVSCRMVGTPLVDETPAILTVNQGIPYRVVAIIEEDSMTAGDSVEVTCQVEDKNGNVLPLDTVVEPVEGATITDHTLSGDEAGTYEVYCATVEDFGELESIPDSITIVAAEASKLELAASPKKAAYNVADQIAIISTVTDSFGNVIADVPVTLTVPTELKVVGAKYEFKTEGIFVVTGVVDDNPSITAELTLVCDSTGPAIVMFKPERGATLDGDANIDIEGTAIDAISEEVDLEINGVGVPVNADGTFYHVMQAQHGINLLTLEAVDGYGKRTEIVQSFYYSTGWVDFNTSDIENVMTDQSMIVFLGQNFLDDGIHDPNQIDDLATLVEILLDGLDFSMLFDTTSPVFSYPLNGIVNYDFAWQGFEFNLSGDLLLSVYIAQIDVAKPSVMINTRNGGLDMHFAFLGTATQEAAEVAIWLDVDFILTATTSFGGSQLFDASLNPQLFVASSASLGEFSMDAVLDIEKQPGQPLQFAIANLGIGLEEIDIDPLDDLEIDLGPVMFNNSEVFTLPAIPLGTLVSGLNDIISDYVLNPILNFTESVLLDFLLPFLDGPLGMLIQNLVGELQIELPIPLPQLPGADQAVTINFKTRLDSLIFTDDGGTVGLDAGFLASKGVERDPLGSILRMNCLSNAVPVPPEFDVAEKMEIGALLDMVNELFFSLWWGGGLSLVLDDSVLGGLGLDGYGISDMSLDLDFLLPPIMDDCTAKEMVEVQIGDLLITASFKMMGAPVKLKMYISLALDASIYGDGNNIGLHILGFTDLGTQMVEVVGNLLGVDVGDLVEGVLLPMIVEQVTDFTLDAFPIPEIDLSSLVPGVPAGTTLTLGNLDIGMSHGYLVIGGELQ